MNETLSKALVPSAIRIAPVFALMVKFRVTCRPSIVDVFRSASLVSMFIPLRIAASAP